MVGGTLFCGAAERGLPWFFIFMIRRKNESRMIAKPAILSQDSIAPNPPSAGYESRNATLCTPVISKRLRQRMFLQTIMSSRRSM